MQTTTWKAAAAGLIAGLIGTYVKSKWEEQFPVRDEQTDSPPVKLLQQAGQQWEAVQIDDYEKGATAVHWTFGTSVGLAHGLMTEWMPPMAIGAGIPLGVGLYIGTHASMVPALQLEPFPHEVKPRRYALNELAGHLVFGVAVELTRRTVRKVLDSF